MYPIIIRSKADSTKWVVLNGTGQFYLIAEIITGAMKFVSFDDLESQYKFVKLVRGEISVGE